jgi:hypothetical protein
MGLCFNIMSVLETDACQTSVLHKLFYIGWFDDTIANFLKYKLPFITYKAMTQPRHQHWHR